MLKKVNEEVKSDEELYKILSHHLSVVDDFKENQPVWKFILVPKLKKKESAIIIKIRHCYGDGISIMTYLMNVGDCKNFKTIRMPPKNVFKFFLILSFGIFKFPFTFLSLLFRKKKINFLHNGKISKEKIIYCSDSMNFEKVKAFSKKNKISINDLFITALTKSLKEYAEENNEVIY